MLNGYSLKLSPDRQQVLSDCVESGQRFAQPVPEFTHGRSVPLLCIVVSENNLVTHLGIGRRGIRAGTGMSRLNLDSLMPLQRPINIQVLIDYIPDKFRERASRKLSEGGLFTPKTFESLIEALNDISQEANGIIGRFSRLRADRIARLPENTKVSLAYQKQAVTTALAVAGMNKDDLLEWSPPAEGVPGSFLDGLPNARLREDPMVINDMMKVPGFDLIRTLPYGAAIFESETERLTVVLANRLPLEEQTGADLIYYNETYNSFVMVQYKAMEREDEERDNVFRLPNVKLEEEIARMDALLEVFHACNPNDNRDGYRLNENPFFIKLCPRVVFEPDTVELVSGMYLPLDYWRLLVIHPSITGPRGGLRVTYGNARRHLTNTEFAALVAKAWIGTNANQSAALAPIIREIVQTGKAVVIAVKSNVVYE
jgi:hypothetical protein